MKTVTFDETKFKLVPIEPDYKILVEIAHAKTATRNGIKAPMTNEELASIYKAGISAASAAEETPQQEPFGYVSEHNCEGPYKFQFHQDHRTIYPDNCKSITPVYVVQQPATHGEPVAEWVEGQSDPKRLAWRTGYVQNAQIGDKLYTSPPPTPELVQAARQALEALGHGVTQLNGIGIPLEAEPLHAAIAALQNALKDTK